MPKVERSSTHGRYLMIRRIFTTIQKDLFIILELQYHQLQSYILFWIQSSLVSQSSSRNDSPKQIASAAFSNSKSIFRYLFLLMAGSNSRQVTLSQSSSRHNPQSPLPLQSELHLAMYYISRHKKQQSKIPPSLLLLSSISNGCWLLAFISCLLCSTLSLKPFGYNACPNSIFRSRLSSRKTVDDDDGVKQFESNYKSNLGMLLNTIVVTDFDFAKFSPHYYSNLQ